MNSVNLIGYCIQWRINYLSVLLDCYVSNVDCLTLQVLHYYLTFSFHLKLALLTQLPTSNERKIPPHLKIKPAKFHNGGFTQDLYMHICSISVKFQLWKNSMNALKSVARTRRVNVYNAEIFLFKPWRPKVFFQFRIIVGLPKCLVFPLPFNI